MREPNTILIARDLMTTNLLVFHPGQSIVDAIQSLIKRGVSGAPVVDDRNTLLGVLSEIDCLRMFASDDFCIQQQQEGATVAKYMSTGGRTVPPDLGIYAVAHYFLTSPIRRIPVVERGKLLGQISRRDVLRGMEEMTRQRMPRKRYPDYRSPA